LKYEKKIKKRINEAAGKIIRKEERPQRNIWFEEECQIILQDKKALATKLLTEISDKKSKNIRKKERRWSEYYEKRFELQDGTDSGSGEECTMCIQTAELYVETPIM
jgi:hypothetical protein